MTIILLLSCQSNKNNNDSKKEFYNSENQKIYERVEFETIFWGKREDYVKKVLGSPDRVKELVAIDVTWWYYQERTYYSSPERIDNVVKVRFDKWVYGDVSEIVYE